MSVPVTAIEILMRGHCTESDGSTRRFVNVFHFRRAIVGTNYTPANILTTFDAQYQHDCASALSVEYVADPSTVRPLDDNTVPEIAAAAAGTNGQIAGDRLPSYASVTIQLITGRRGRSGRGAKRFGPIAESDTTLDELTTLGPFHGARNRIKLIMTDSDGNVWKPIVLSRLDSDLTTIPATIVSSDITDAKLNTTLGIMKRRKQKSRVG